MFLAKPPEIVLSLLPACDLSKGGNMMLQPIKTHCSVMFIQLLIVFESWRERVGCVSGFKNRLIL